MSSLAYLAIAIVLSVAGSLLLYYRHRRPKSLESGIDEFSRELKALAPNQAPKSKQAPKPKQPSNPKRDGGPRRG